MRKNRYPIYILLFLWLFVSQVVKASSACPQDNEGFQLVDAMTSISADDSCTQGIGLLNTIVNNITTLGLFTAYSDSFHLYGANGYGSGDDGENGCLADWYPDNCSYSENDVTGGADSNCDGGAYLHNDTYCQPDGTNCCDDALTCTTVSGVTTCLPKDDSVIGVPCPTGNYHGECNPDGGIEYCYDNYNWTTLNYQCNGSGDPIWSQNGDYAWFFWPSGQMRVTSDGDKICVQFWTTIGYQNIGCKYLPNCTQFYLNQVCYVAESCYSFSAQQSISMLPVTGAIIQCINDSIQYLFYGNPNCNSNNNENGTYVVTSFPEFQGSMRSTVRSALMLYIVLMGLKMVLGNDLPSKGDFFRMGAKFTLVLYFSTGININGVVGTDGLPYYDDGIHRYMIPLFTTGAQELSQWVYSAGGQAGLCVYDESLYPSEYGYLSLWDSIDCRLLYYMGINLGGINLTSTVDNANILSLNCFSQPVLFGLLLPALFSFQIIFLVCSMLFAIMFLSVVIYFVNVTVISAIVVAILIYLAPVFVPMALFEATKGYYDGWLKVSIAYALQPMVIGAYIAMMLTLFDQTMYGDCIFQKYNVIFDYGGESKQDIPFYVLCDPHDSSGNCYNCEDNSCPDFQTTADTNSEYITECNQTIGYFLNPTSSYSYTNTVGMIFFEIVMLNPNIANSMMIGVVTLCLFGYIFYKFADVLDEFAQDLTGGSLGAAAGRPMALVDKAAGAAKDLMKYATSKNSESNSKSSSSDSKQRSGAQASSSDSKQRSGAQASSSDSKNQGGDSNKKAPIKSGDNPG